MSLAVLFVLLAVPLVTHAFPFGGRASIVLQCVHNSTIYTNLGPPRGGEYVWTTATRTYQFGPPSHAGQWMLGLAGAPYYCLYRVAPVVIYTAVAMTMMGSSGPAAPSAPPTRGPSPTLPTLPGTGSSSGSSSGSGSGSSGSGSSGKLLVSEVYYSVDVPHGTKPANEWIEIYNGSANTVDLSGWRIHDNVASSTIPAGTTLAPEKFLVISPSASTRDLWSLTSTTQFLALGGTIGDGLLSTGDRIIVRNAAGTIIDAVSWGSDTFVMEPSVPYAPYGNSLTRTNLTSDTDSANDWASRSPSPGN